MAYRVVIGLMMLCVAGAAHAQKLPMCDRTDLADAVSLTFAHCHIENNGPIRGILRGGAGVEVMFSRSDLSGGITTFTKVDSVDTSKQKEIDEVVITSKFMWRDVNRVGSKEIQGEAIPEWLFAFVEAHFSELSQYRGQAGVGFIGVERVMAERQKVVAAQAAAQRQRDEQERQQQAASQAEAAQQARDQAAQRERQMQDIRRQLGNLNAGQLFARADEYRNKGQIDEAREALRLLVSKFPNHGLAPTAAQQLASLPQEGGPMPTPQPGGQGTVGGWEVSEVQEVPT